LKNMSYLPGCEKNAPPGATNFFLGGLDV